ncbi:hypothetical protein M0813_26378 [Anaeramoeba flamelloides]|uniref:Uncharacterized protein n=1 Tax=Anaeramoeba flamelloides TaxID=1746091 RepID=A0ABQ8Y0Q2_9EUKA|nr:hypothetical protein M0813_26378 [Anaeramoeba flamelloides]
MDKISKNAQFTLQGKIQSLNKARSKNKRTSQRIHTRHQPSQALNKLNKHNNKDTIRFRSLQNIGSKSQNKKSQILSTKQETKKINTSVQKENVLNSTTSKNALNIDKYYIFLDLVRNRFKDQPEIYQKYLSITTSMRYIENYKKSIQTVVNLFSEHPDLKSRYLELVNGEYEYNSGNVNQPNSTIRKAIEFISLIRRSFPQNSSDKYLQLINVFQKLEQNNNKITLDKIKNEVFNLFEGKKEFIYLFNNYLSTFNLPPVQNDNNNNNNNNNDDDDDEDDEKDLDIFKENNENPNFEKNFLQIEKQSNEQKKNILNQQSLIFSNDPKEKVFNFLEQKLKKEYPLFFPKLFPMNQNYRSQINLSNFETKKICNKMYENIIVKKYEVIDKQFENRNLEKKEMQKIKNENEREKQKKNVDKEQPEGTIIQKIIEKLLLKTESDEYQTVNRKRGFDSLQQNNNIGINTNLIKGVFQNLKTDLNTNDYFSLLKLINNYFNNTLNFNQFINLSEKIINKQQNSKLFESFYSIMCQKSVLKTSLNPKNISKGNQSAFSSNLLSNKVTIQLFLSFIP